MDCVIHIGTEKTGTTSIQRTLDDNVALLKEQGLFWPPMLREGEDPRVACYAMNDETVDLRKQRRKLTTPEKIATFRKQFEGRFGRELAKAPDTRRVLIINEHLSRLREPEELRRLKRFLDGFCDRTQVVIYLRRQDRMMRSMYAQVVKVGGTRRNVFPDHAEGSAGDFTTFNYRRIADLWAGVFGRDALKIRVFETPRLTGGDVVRDFFRIAGIVLPEEVEPIRTNESLSIEAILALRLLNQYLPRAARGNLGPLSGRLFSGSGMPVARADAVRFLSYFEADNDHVAREYMGRPHLFEPIGAQEYPETVPPETLEIEPDALARIFARLWEAKVRRL